MTEGIAAIVLAAGESRRMGQPKLLLPWGGTSVLGQVAATLQRAGIADILIVTGAGRDRVELEAARLAGTIPLRCVFNPGHAGGMLSSLQTGLRAMEAGVRAALVVLGDQPQIQPETVIGLCRAFRRTGKSLVIPSYRQHGGHPWLVARPLWEGLLALCDPATPRSFLQAHRDEIDYVPAIESILLDLDTPEDYRKQKP
jgi:molybdenum cofactor cytidylyltransferase